MPKRETRPRTWSIWNERVRLLLDQEGLSQAECARRVGLEPPTFQRYLSVRHSEPDFDVLVAVCRVLRTHPNYLLGYSDDHREPPSQNRVRALEARLEQVERQIDKKRDK